ncbi:MAG TPA: staygreen family protein [Bacillota bacterium]|nr:staygreen family protein [Bacillota bacterium]
MSRLNPEKLSLEYRDGVTSAEPVIRRRYTLTHSDITAHLFLTIGFNYAYDQINATRDEVLGEWVQSQDCYFYNVYLHVDGTTGTSETALRDAIFRRELPLALEAIRYGDRRFFLAHPELDQSPIKIYFFSVDPQYNKIENWGIFSDFTILQ